MADRKQEILGAALRGFAEKGLAGTTVEEVRRRSGASVGSIYHHFGGVDGIAVSLYVEILREYQAGLVRALKRAHEAESGVEALVRHHLRWVERNPGRARFLLQGGSMRAAAGEELKELNRSLSASIGEWIEHQTEIRPQRREVFYAVIIGPAHELSRAWLSGRIPSLRELEDELAAAAWRAIRADDRSRR